MIMAAVGGTVSDITGGKFANGAVSGAFVHLFNAEGKSSWDKTKKFFSRVWNRTVSNYQATMNFKIDKYGFVTFNDTGSIGSTSAVIHVKNSEYKGLGYKPYLSKTSWALSGFKTTAMGFVDTAIFRVIEPIAIAELAFKGGVAIGSLGIALYEEF